MPWQVASPAPGRVAAANHTGGMIALFPRTDSALAMAVPTGESVGDLHCTLVFLGDDVADQDAPDPLLQSLAHLADSFTVIDAQVTGRAIFEEGAVVYLIGDNPQLPDLHTDALNAAYTITTVPRQHEPWQPHVTVGYDIDPRQLDFRGTVLFDRLGVALGSRTHYFPLLGATVGEY